jgi:hypothetical protein
MLSGYPDRFLNVNLCVETLILLGVSHLFLSEGVER